MSSDRQHYSSPLSDRYASPEMQYLFSAEKKFRTWRRLWVVLAQSERELGLDITEEQIAEMAAHQDDLNYEVAEAKEKELRHDVMSQIYAYGVQCPQAKPIIHLGATSCYVGDNADIIIMREALRLIRVKTVRVIAALATFAEKYQSLPTLGYTHFQAAQPTTVGKRATLWINDLMMDYDNADRMIGSLKLLGSKGTTGTQASFLELFAGDKDKVRRLDPLIAAKLGFAAAVPVSGQTYSRKTDFEVLAVLSGIAQSAHKFSNDLRLLQHLKEIEEPFGSAQVGSSAMAYKRNPMRCERMASLADHLILEAGNPAIVEATQWLERTLDDSADRRLAIPETFLAADGILELYLNIVSGLTVHPLVIRRHLEAELPFMASENLLMDAVKAGGDRQALHERIRQLSLRAAARVKDEGLDNNLLELLAQDPEFARLGIDVRQAVDPARYIGMSADQTADYLRDYVRPLVSKYQSELAYQANIER